jgi:hypothetical protein
MRTATYKQAQQSYDSQEHPDYWDDHEEEDEIIESMLDVCKGPFMAMADRKRGEENGKCSSEV